MALEVLNKHWVTEIREGGTIEEPVEPTGLLHGWTMGRKAKMAPKC